jgi:metal-responsive CopG/Arc/MetJ family transcriptional regulator
MSKTISITIPEQLELDLSEQAKKVGLSRSRFIGNILLKWQEETKKPLNDCFNQRDGYCAEFGISCTAPQHEAETCSDYCGPKKKQEK